MKTLTFFKILLCTILDEVSIKNCSRFDIQIEIIVPEPFYILVSSKYKEFWKAFVYPYPEEAPTYDNDDTDNVQKYLKLFPEDETYDYMIESYESTSTEIVRRFNFISLRMKDEQVIKLTIEFEPQSNVNYCYVIKADMKIDFKTHLRYVCA